MTEGTATSRDRLTTPLGWLIPLRDEGQSARSYVFALTHWLRPSEVEDHLPSASNFTGHDIPYRASEVICLPLNADGFNQLPASLFARELVTSFDWSNPKPGAFAAAFAEQHGRDGYIVPLSGLAVILREGQRPDNGIDLPAGEGALWRDGRATICLDLDDMFRNDTLRALYATVSDLSTAGGVIGLERSILDGRAMKWDSNLGRFLSPEETLESYQGERVEALDRLGDAVFRTPVFPGRLRFVLPQMRARAENRKHSLVQESRISRRSNLAMVVSSLLADEVADFATRISSSPPLTLTEWAPDLVQFRQALEVKLKTALNRAMTEDYLDPKWHRKIRGTEVKLGKLDPAAPSAVECEVEHEDLSPEEAVLAKGLGRKLLSRANLSPTEKRVLAAIAGLEDDDSLAAWAERNGMNPATARVHKLNAKKKIERAKKLT